MNAAISHGQKDIEPIYSQFLQILKSNGLEEVSPLNLAFDPSQHEAVGMVETDKKENDHTIVDVFQKGYSLEGKVIIPAKVRVGEYRQP